MSQFLSKVQTLFLIFMISLKAVSTLIVLQQRDKSEVTWLGCVFQKFNISLREDKKCVKCSTNPDSPKVTKSYFPQTMVNCSSECEHSTICTTAHYYNTAEDSIQRPICYQCENRKNEILNFTHLKEERLCTDECRECGRVSDLSRASQCAHLCNGLPTFCYPVEMHLGHRICYQASFWFGCDFNEILSNSTNQACFACALTARNSTEAQECADLCEGFPTYSEGTQSSSKKDSNEMKLMQCQKAKIPIHGDYFLYEIPKRILPFLHVSNPGFLYPVELLTNSFVSGSIGKLIITKFNMTQLTFPRGRPNS